MKRRFCFFSLLLFLCLLLPVFSVSASAISVDGYDVSTRVLNESGVYQEFTNTIVFNSSANRLIIMLEIELPEVIPKDTVFDLEVEFSIGDYLTISEYNGGGTMYDSNWVLLDGKLDGIVKDGKLNEFQIIAMGDVKYIRYVFDIYDPTWVVIDNSPDIIYFSVDQISNTYPAEKGMTWEEWCDSDYNTFGAYCDNIVHFPYVYMGSYLTELLYNNGGGSVRPYDEIFADTLYLTSHVGGSNDPGIEGPSASYSVRTTMENSTSVSSVSGVEYQFQFQVTSVSITEEDDNGIFGGIFGWVKKIFNAVLDMPNLIGSKLTEFGNWLINQIKGLFIPSEESVIDIKNKFESLLADRFGAAYQSVEIVDQFGQAMGISTYADADPTVSFPSVTVDLAGTPFTFGGWEVDLVPKGFEALLTPLRLIVDIVCTIAFVNTFRRRMEGILG